MADGGNQHHGFEQVRFEARTVPEICRYCVGNRVGAFADHVFKLVEAVDPDAGGRSAFLALGVTLQLEQAGSVGHRWNVAVHNVACSTPTELSLSRGRDSSAGTKTFWLAAHFDAGAAKALSFAIQATLIACHALFPNPNGPARGQTVQDLRR